MEWLAKVYTTTYRWIRDQLEPEHRYGLPPRSVVTIERIRTVSAIAVATLTSWKYTGLGGLGDAINAPAHNLMYALPALLVAGAVMLVAAHPGQRHDLWQSLGWPLVVAGVLTIALMGAVRIVNSLAELRSDPTLLSVLLALLLGLPVALVLAVYVAPALLWASYLAVRHWFCGADGHPMLPALTTGTFALAHIATLPITGLEEAMPVGVGLLVGVGCPLGLAATAVIELWLLAQAGHSIRALPATPEDADSSGNSPGRPGS
jgi:hypothetical protein